MLSGTRVLLVEDEAIIALDLADTFASAGADVVGPVSSVREALRLLDGAVVDTALLDFNVADGEVTPVLDLLISRGVPVVIYTGRGLPEALSARHPNLSVLRKPLSTARIVEELVRVSHG
jgi:DNA-binding NtrC family response regulator